MSTRVDPTPNLCQIYNDESWEQQQVHESELTFQEKAKKADKIW